VAAHVLGRAGWRVLLTDRAPARNHRIGETLLAAAVRLLTSIGLDTPSLERHARIGGNLTAWGSDALAATDFLHDPDGAGWRLDRVQFDSALRGQAARSGALIKQRAVVDIARQDGVWHVVLDDATRLSARWLVDATGRRSMLARKLGAVRHRDSSLVALYAHGLPHDAFRLEYTLVESVPIGWWYAARLPSGAPIAGVHLDPQDAVRLVAQRDGWRGALAATRHLAPHLAPIGFAEPMPAVEACGACLDRVFGAGWIACGDAALSFDPLSSQGIFTALYGALHASRALLAFEAGSALSMQEYAARLNRVRDVYIARWRALYRSEMRWSDERFWMAAHRAALLPQTRIEEGPLAA
jgi:flavin-dependent dehydrogenase